MVGGSEQRLVPSHGHRLARSPDAVVAATRRLYVPPHSTSSEILRSPRPSSRTGHAVHSRVTHLRRYVSELASTSKRQITLRYPVSESAGELASELASELLASWTA